MDANFWQHLSSLDGIGLGVFAVCFLSYVWVQKRPADRLMTLNHIMNIWRVRWMDSLTTRDVRIMDTQLLGHIMHSVTFFASTSILVLAGLAAAFGAADRAAAALSGIPFILPLTGEQFAIRLLLPTAFFVYAFFVFTMGIRQFNYVCVLMGALSNFPESEERQRYVAQAAEVLGYGSENFNAGLRSYYFALASMGWFFHPLALAGFSIAVSLLLLIRQTSGRTRRTLLRHETPE